MTDWRDNWNINKHWFDIHGQGLWKDGQRVYFLHDPSICGTVVVGDWGEFRVREDGASSSEIELLDEWRRIDE